MDGYLRIESTIINGSRPGLWKISFVEEVFFYDPGNDEEKYMWSKENRLKKVRTLKNYKQSWKRALKFYTGYWLSIWIMQGINK